MGKLYTYKHDRIVSEFDHWTGHIDDYFNKRFTFKKIKQLVINVDDNISQLIDKCNNEKVEIYKNLSNEVKFPIESSVVHINKDGKLDRSKIKEFLSEEQVDAVDYCVELLKESRNTIFEFADLDGNRCMFHVFDCHIKPFEGQIDIDNYLTKKQDVEKFNLSVEKDMYQHLISLNAIEDYINYHSSRNNMFKQISKTINKLDVNG